MSVCLDMLDVNTVIIMFELFYVRVVVDDRKGWSLHRLIVFMCFPDVCFALGSQNIVQK